MSDLGQQLKEARLQKGLSLEDVQEVTKIRKRYLEAIEQGDFKVLPGSFYVRAFIKTYAEAVDLDPEALLQNHPKDVPAVETENVMEPVLTKRSARTSGGSGGNGGSSRGGSARGEGSKGLSTALMWTFPILILLIVGIVYFNNTKDNKPETAATPTEETATSQQPADNSTAEPATDETATPPATGGGTQDPTTDTSTDEPATDTPDTTTPPATGDTTTEPPADGTGTDTGTTEGDPATPGTDEGTQTGEEGTGETAGTPNTSGSTIVTPAGQEGKTTVFNAQPAQGGAVKVTINASGLSWLEVYRGSTSGERLYYQNTEAGEALTFDLDAQGLYIKSGYSPYTDIRIDGQQITDGKTTSRFKVNLTN
ncbi:helix-turn-helix domain-containing protein [Saccharibacillus sp. JS10]|uniref:helix-turn-helix domain-containing protein n=1 Tax=Saccharibacillus sp. JS10 TaxID=2950552 RepID=UPI00210D5758|nr:helix-turn-helix domain-containing protein [Saccharibacillus sp. JS10]MCQ4087251.1 helix-turn-helix domain-containing protein [Saccharibacillus sp. JS10]